MNKEKIVDVLNTIGKAFQNPNVTVSSDRVSFGVAKLNTRQLATLGEIARDLEAEVELKRSGTGIAVYFN